MNFPTFRPFDFSTAAAAATVAAAAATAAMAVDVTNVTMSQNSATCKVTINYTLSGPAVVTLDILTNAVPNAADGWTSIGGEHICNAQGDVWKKIDSAGTYTITWQPIESWLDENGDGFKVASGCAKARVSAWPLDNTPDYMVVDISSAAQPNTQRYYPRVDFLPGSVLGQKGAVTNNPNYKTSMLVMRKIMAKDVTWTMGSTGAETQRVTDNDKEATHQVTLTNNYYIGIFEVTQSQFAEVWPNYIWDAPRWSVEGSMRPRDTVWFNAIRGNEDYYWPNDPDPTRFFGLLRTRTGIMDFDFPSEAQWEFAARAGNGSGYWGDGSAILNNNTDANLGRIARYRWNAPSTANNATAFATLGPSQGGTAIVGSYAPNAWGLYDMFGNVAEYCLDWYQDDISDYNGRVNVNSANPQQYLDGTAIPSDRNNQMHVKKGGCWDFDAYLCRPAWRSAQSTMGSSHNYGFRVVCRAGLK